ncbi:MAG: hypothetical protein HYX32_05865 [Actinobacteria bacterium]|nr:hypothetical protein [Actinomycetota bacterium]
MSAPGSVLVDGLEGRTVEATDVVAKHRQRGIGRPRHDDVLPDAPRQRTHPGDEIGLAIARSEPALDQLGVADLEGLDRPVEGGVQLRAGEVGHDVHAV